MGTFVLKEVMFCRRACIVAGQVLQECTFSGWHIFQDNVSYWNARFTGGQVLLKGMSYR